MSDAFISYSRKDKEFVDRLFKAFCNLNRDVWYDKEDIPLAADWREEMYLGIEEADNLVFVISPDSVASRPCTQEIEHAIKHNKRLIPIMYRYASSKTVHEAIRCLNFIPFTEEDDFDTAFKKLIDAIDTDLDYVKEHTRLLKRAIEWDKKNRNPSLLLRGTDLNTARTWLGESGAKQPSATPLHTQYIIVSGQAESKQQKAMFGIAAVGLAIACGLAVWADQNRRDAEVQRNLAREKQIAALTALSEVKLLTGDDLGSLIASVQAAKQVQQAEAPLPELEEEARTALREAVYNVQERNRLEGHVDQINRVTFSPNGALLASASNDNTVKLWKKDGTLLHTMYHGDHVRRVVFSPDGKLLLSSSKDKTIKLWDTNGKLVRTIPQDEEVRAIAFSPDGKTIAAGDKLGTVKFWSLDGKLQKTLDKVHSGEVNDVAYSPDGKLVATSSGDRTIKLWTLEGELQNTFTGHEDKVWDISFSPNGRAIASASSDSTIRIWKLDGQLLRPPLKAHTNWVRSVSFSKDGKILVSGSDDNTVKLWSFDGTLMGTFQGHASGIKSVAFSPDGKLIASASDDRTIKLRSIEGSVVEILHGHRSGIKGVRYSPDGQYIASVDTDDTLKLWRGQDGTVLLKNVVYTSALRNVNFSNDGKLLVTASYDNNLQVWRLEDVRNQTKPKPRHLLQGHTSTVKNLSISPDDKLIASGGADKTIKLWSINGELLRSWEAHEPEVTDLSFSPTEEIIVSVGADGGVKLWDYEGKLLQKIEGHEEWINAVHFSPDGKFFVTASGDNTVKIWKKGDDGAFQLSADKILEGNEDWVWDVAVSKDGKFVASAGKDNTVRLWNTEGKLLTTLRQHENWVRAVSFSPDSSKLASASADKTIILWDLKSLDELKNPDQERSLDALIGEGCVLLRDYLKTNTTIRELNEHTLCDPPEET